MAPLPTRRFDEHPPAKPMAILHQAGFWQWLRDEGRVEIDHACTFNTREMIVRR
jgi:hypothetical protein